MVDISIALHILNMILLHALMCLKPTRVMVDMSVELIENMPGSLPGWTLKHPRYRVAKCHGYDGYIRVKIIAGWGKKSGRTRYLAKFR